MPVPPVEETSHPWLNYDSQLLTQALYNDNSSKRYSLAVRIRNALRLDDAEGFDLVDIGMHNYAVDTSHAPFEFAIVDRQYPQGLGPSEGERARFDLYDAGRVAELLNAAGFDGVFIDPNEKRTSAKGRGLLLPPIENDVTIPWTSLAPGEEHLPAGFVLPALLEARSPEAFTLSLPSPLHEHTVLLLRAYGRCLPAFPELVTQAYAWFRSWGTIELRPLTVALLVIAYMQRSPEIKAPDLQNIPSSMIASVEHTVYMPYRATANGSTAQLPLTVRYAPSLPQKMTEGPGVLFAGFIKWLKNMKSPYHGSVGKSTTKLKHVLLRPVRAVTETKGWGKHAADIINAKPGKTEPWTWQALIMVDPFVPTFNRAFEVSRELLESLFDLADGVNATLSWGSSLTSAFGPAVDVPVYRAILPDLDTTQEPTRSASPRTSPLPTIQQTRGIHLSARRFYSSQSSQNQDLRSLIDLYSIRTRPPPALVRNRAELVRRIEWAIQKAYGARYTVEVFGSSRYGMDKGDSDLDLVICDSALPIGFPPHTPKQLPPVYNPWNVSKAINAAKINVRVDQVIKSAAVPIAKLTDRLTHIRCDICCNDRLGLRNTELLAHYTDILPDLRVVVKALKRWAKGLGLNEPSPPGGKAVTLSSYAFTLLVIGLYQARGILPNVQDVPSAQPGTTRIFYARTRASGPIKCNVGWDPLPLAIPAESIPSTDQLLLDFFRYYGYQHDYARDIVSVREGGIVRRQKEIKLEGKRGKEQAGRLGVVSLVGTRVDEERWEDEPEMEPTSRKARREKKIKANDAGVEGVNPETDTQVEAQDGGPLALPEGVSAEVVAEVEAQANAVQEDDAVVAEAAEESVSEGEDDEPEHAEAERPASQASDSSANSISSLQRWTEKDEALSTIEPDLWRTHALVVADPFIRNKNTAGNVKPDSVLRFRAECQRAYMMLTQYHNVQDQSSGPFEALHTILTPHIVGEDVLPTGPLPPLPERPPPKKRRVKGNAQQVNAEAGSSTPASVPTPAPAPRVRASEPSMTAEMPVVRAESSPKPRAHRITGSGRLPRTAEASDTPGSDRPRGKGRPRGSTNRGGGRGGGRRGRSRGQGHDATVLATGPSMNVQSNQA